MLDLTKILKDCPKGTKLYSPICGEVEFSGINPSTDYPIRTIGKPNTTNEKERIVFTAEGKYLNNENGECLLFPSKDNQDWSTFEVKKPKFDINCLKPFDKVLVRDTNNEKWSTSFFSHKVSTGEFLNFVTSGGQWMQCIPYNETTAKLIGTKDPAPEYYKNWKD